MVTSRVNDAVELTLQQQIASRHSICNQKKYSYMKNPFSSQFGDAQIERLASILEKHALPNDGFDLESLDGYLSALVVGPESVMPSEWVPTVWGEKQPEWSSEAELTEAYELLMAFWNRCVEIAQRGDPLPDHLYPMIMMPENPESNHPDSAIIGTLWGHGFIQGTRLRLQQWVDLINKEEWIAGIFRLILELSTGEKTVGKKSRKRKILTYSERLDIIAEIPGMLADLNDYRMANYQAPEPVRRAATPERNEPCPCGSGKKYKKCCGFIVLH
jgi:uncharacterized protein